MCDCQNQIVTVPCQDCADGFSFIEAAKSSASAVKDILASSPKADHDLMKRRIAVCKTCDSLSASDFIPPGNCKICGCFIFLKVQYSGQNCPKGKW